MKRVVPIMDPKEEDLESLLATIKVKDNIIRELMKELDQSMTELKALKESFFFVKQWWTL